MFAIPDANVDDGIASLPSTAPRGARAISCFDRVERHACGSDRGGRKRRGIGRAREMHERERYDEGACDLELHRLQA